MTQPAFNDLEYASLREEVVKRIEIRQQVLAIALTIAGVLLGFGVSAPGLALVYPPLALFLTAMWAQNDNRVLQICDYLHRFETPETKLGWVGYYSRIQKQRADFFDYRFSLSVFAPGGLFIITSLMAFVIGATHPSTSVQDWVLLLLAGASIVFTSVLLITVRRARTRARSFLEHC